MNYCKLHNLIELLLLSIQSGEKVKKLIQSLLLLSQF